MANPSSILLIRPVIFLLQLCLLPYRSVSVPVQIGTLVGYVKKHFTANQPWQDPLSEIYYTPEVTTAVEALTAQAQFLLAAYVYECCVDQFSLSPLLRTLRTPKSLPDCQLKSQVLHMATFAPPYVQPEVSNPQLAVQLSVPPAKPCV